MALTSGAGDMLRGLMAQDTTWMHEELLKTLDSEDLLPRTAEEIVQAAWRLRAFDELEVLGYPRLSSGNIGSISTVLGLERLEAALALGHGAIVMIGHFGANQMIMPALGYRGYTMNQLSAPPTVWGEIRTDGRANPVWKQVQERRWALEQTLPVQHINVFSFLPPAYRCLEANQVLGLAFDGGGGTSWVPMPMGKRTAYVSTQPWQLARATGAVVLPAVVVRQPRQAMHQVVLHAPISVEKTSDKKADISAAVSQFSRFFNRMLKRHPDHYLPFLLHRRKLAAMDTHPFFADYT